MVQESVEERNVENFIKAFWNDGLVGEKVYNRFITPAMNDYDKQHAQQYRAYVKLKCNLKYLNVNDEVCVNISDKNNVLYLWYKLSQKLRKDFDLKAELENLEDYLAEINERYNKKKELLDAVRNDGNLYKP